MRKFFATLMVLTFVSTAALAEADHHAPAAPDGAPDKAAVKEEKFDEVKAKRLAKIAEHMEALKKKEACVQAAADFTALKACYPKRGERMEKMKEHMKEGGMDGHMDMGGDMPKDKAAGH